MCRSEYPRGLLIHRSPTVGDAVIAFEMMMEDKLRLAEYPEPKADQMEFSTFALLFVSPPT